MARREFMRACPKCESVKVEVRSRVRAGAHQREKPMKSAKSVKPAKRTARGRAQDRGRVAAGQGYEVNYFATKHGITREQARDLIARIGNDRTKLNAAAEALKKRRR